MTDAGHSCRLGSKAGVIGYPHPRQGPQESRASAHTLGVGGDEQLLGTAGTDPTVMISPPPSSRPTAVTCRQPSPNKQFTPVSVDTRGTAAESMLAQVEVLEVRRDRSPQIRGDLDSPSARSAASLPKAPGRVVASVWVEGRENSLNEEALRAKPWRPAASLGYRHLFSSRVAAGLISPVPSRRGRCRKSVTAGLPTNDAWTRRLRENRPMGAVDWMQVIYVGSAVSNVRTELVGDWHRDPWAWPELGFVLKEPGAPLG